MTKFQPTRPVRGVTPHFHFLFMFDDVSTHTPRAGRDPNVFDSVFTTNVFQPTRPVRGVTRIRKEFGYPEMFQPTRPVRGVTADIFVVSLTFEFQPTRPVRGVTLEPLHT